MVQYSAEFSSWLQEDACASVRACVRAGNTAAPVEAAAGAGASVGISRGTPVLVCSVPGADDAAAVCPGSLCTCQGVSAFGVVVEVLV